MKIGLISDTHGYLDDKIYHYFDACDEVWHMGDVGNVSVLDDLSKRFKTRCVYGNIDGKEVRVSSPEYQIFDLESKRFLLIHIAGKPLSYNQKVRDLIKSRCPDVLICGHSHLLKIVQDPKHKLLFINPGAAGRQGFHKIRTLVRFDLNAGKIDNMEVIELGSRSKLN